MTRTRRRRWRLQWCAALVSLLVLAAAHATTAPAPAHPEYTTQPTAPVTHSHAATQATATTTVATTTSGKTAATPTTTVAPRRARARNCTPPAIQQFPRPLMGPAARKEGGLILHIIVAVYTFLGLAIVCDDYFVSSLDRICEVMDASPDMQRPAASQSKPAQSNASGLLRLLDQDTELLLSLPPHLFEDTQPAAKDGSFVLAGCPERDGSNQQGGSMC